MGEKWENYVISQILCESFEKKVFLQISQPIFCTRFPLMTLKKSAIKVVVFVKTCIIRCFSYIFSKKLNNGVKNTNPVFYPIFPKILPNKYFSEPLTSILNITKIILECPPQDFSANEVDFRAFLERPVHQTAKGYTLKQRKT